MKDFTCPYKGSCFGKDDLRKVCRVLSDIPETDVCHFQKPRCDVTKGVEYPYNRACTVDGAPDYPARPREAWAVDWDITTGKLMGR